MYVDEYFLCIGVSNTSNLQQWFQLHVGLLLVGPRNNHLDNHRPTAFYKSEWHKTACPLQVVHKRHIL